MNTKFYWLFLFIVGAVVLVSASFLRDRPGDISPTPDANVSPNPNISITSSPAFSPKPSKNPETSSPGTIRTPIISVIPKAFPTPLPPGLITGPATCQLAGQIRFIDQNTYVTEGAKIVYQNIDHGSRFIFWKTDPDDGVLRVGPNIFAELKLPNGERDIGVSVSKSTSVKEYILTASVTYGVTNSKGSEEIKTAACAGSSKVIMP